MECNKCDIYHIANKMSFLVDDLINEIESLRRVYNSAVCYNFSTRNADSNDSESLINFVDANEKSKT